MFLKRSSRHEGNAETQPDLLLTLSEAAKWLDPPMTEEQLRGLVHVARLRPRGFRRSGGAGRPARTYPMAKLNLLHAAVAPLIHEFSQDDA